MCKSINDSPATCDCDDCLPPGSMDEPAIVAPPPPAVDPSVLAKCKKAFRAGTIGRARYYYFDGDTGAELLESPNLGNGPSPIGPDGARMRHARIDTNIGTPLTLTAADFPGRAIIVKSYHPELRPTWFWLTSDPAVANRPLPRFCKGKFD